MIGYKGGNRSGSTFDKGKQISSNFTGLDSFSGATYAIFRLRARNLANFLGFNNPLYDLDADRLREKYDPTT